MNNFLEFINKDIDGKKEQISTLPLRTKVNKKKYNETIDKMTVKYNQYKDNVYKYLTVKAKSLIKLKKVDEDTGLIEEINKLEGAKNLLNPFNTFIEKMGFDSLLFQFNCCYTLNFKSLNHIINGFLDKFELAGIILEESDFDYTCYVKQYMESFLEVRNKGDKDYTKISEIFEQIYWLNPELIQHIDLNFRKLLRKYSSNFNNYLDKLKNEVKSSLDLKDYEDCLNKIAAKYSELNGENKESIEDVVRLCIDGDIDIEHFKDDNKVKKVAFATLLGDDFDITNTNKFNRVCDDLNKLKDNLIELSNYITFEPLFEEFKTQFGKLENEGNNKKNKVITEFENKIIKAESELDKLNKKIASGKKSIFGGTLSEIDIKNLKIDSVLKAKELYDLYKDYEKEYFKDKVETIISSNMSVRDLLRLYSSFDYFKKLTINKVFEVESYDEIDDLAVKYDSFASNPFNNIMEGLLVFGEFDIPQTIVNKYRLSGIAVDEESLNEDNINALINKINIVIRANIIENGNIPLEKIWFVTKVNKYKKD
jgi:hypothetical protein